MLEHISYPQQESSPHTPLKEKQILNSKNLELSSWEIKKIISSTELVVLKWYPWHAKAMRKLGPDKYLELADMAKQGAEPQTLFSWLIREELK